jgi:hypothetical protein
VQPLRMFALATAVLTAATLPVTFTISPASATTSITATAQAGITYYAYHGFNSAASDAMIHKLIKQRYRPIAFSVSNAASPRYASSWVKAPGASFWIYQDMSANGYQQRFNTYRDKGFQPTVVSATGSGNDAVFAAIFEKATGKWFAKHGITTAQFNSANKTAAKEGYILTSVNVYGTPSDPRYAAIWSENRSGMGWAYTYGKTSAQNSVEFKTRVANGYRPTDIAVAPGGTYTTVWIKDASTPFYAYQGMSSSGYQRRFEQLRAKGFYPVQVDAENGTYAAVWAKA